MDERTHNPSLEELADRVRSGRSTPVERQTLFHASFSIETEAGQDVDFEAMGSDPEEMRGWREQYAADAQAAKERCDAEIVERPTY